MLLASALGVSCGVMVYVSFYEIYALKSVEGFSVDYPKDGDKLATLCFFCGILITYTMAGPGLTLVAFSQHNFKPWAVANCPFVLLFGSHAFPFVPEPTEVI